MGRSRTGWGTLIGAAAAPTVSLLLSTGCVGGSSSAVSTPGQLISEQTTAGPTTPGPTTVESSAGTPGNTSPDEQSETGIAPSADMFTTQRAVLHGADGAECEVCLWVADTAVEHRQGLMGVTSLGEADGMVFVFDQDTTGSFWMKDTVIDLDIVFFNAEGGAVGKAEMTPCVTASCELYGPGVPYRTAAEFATGHLTELGITNLQRIELTEASCSLDPTMR